MDYGLTSSVNKWPTTSFPTLTCVSGSLCNPGTTYSHLPGRTLRPYPCGRVTATTGLVVPLPSVTHKEDGHCLGKRVVLTYTEFVFKVVTPDERVTEEGSIMTP